MLLGFFCKWGAESQSWESNFQVKSKSKEEVAQLHFLTSVFKQLFSFGWRHYRSIQLQFSPADKPPICISQVDKSGGWWYMCPLWRWGRRSYYVFPLTLQLYSTDLLLPFNPSQLTISNIWSYFFLLPDYFPHICLPLMHSNPHCPRELSSFSLLWPWSCSAPLWHIDTTAELNQGHPAERC